MMHTRGTQFDYRAVTHRDSVFDVYEQMVEIVKHQTVTALYGVHPHAGWCVFNKLGQYKQHFGCEKMRRLAKFYQSGPTTRITKVGQYNNEQ
jgi:hypothetical protein